MLVKAPVIRFYEWTKAYINGIFIISKDWQDSAGWEKCNSVDTALTQPFIDSNNSTENSTI